MRQRINISARPRLYVYLEARAAEQDQPLATVAEQLLYDVMQAAQAPAADASHRSRSETPLGDDLAEVARLLTKKD